MVITPQTTVNTLLGEYPFLKDFLVGYNPEFKKLANPVLRRTMGRMATLERAAGMAGVPLEEMQHDIAAEIGRVTGVTPEIQAKAGFTTVDPARQAELKAIVKELHAGASPDDLKDRFAMLIEDIEATEIAAMEQKLIEEGIPEAEVKRLCDVHVQVFAEALDEHDAVQAPEGHPVDTFMRENQAFRQVLVSLRKVAETIGKPARREEWERLAPAFRATTDRVREFERHYVRKENQLFPFLERHGIEGPSKVMWALHDDIRAVIRELRAALDGADPDAAVQQAEVLATMGDDMIYKEEKILFPMAMDNLAEWEWIEIRQGEDEIGYALVGEPSAWPNVQVEVDGGRAAAGAALVSEGELALDTGVLTLEQLNLMLRSLPVDVTFVDENERVRYYSEGERVFPRSPAVIGRKVENCHPPASVYKVEQILEAFHSGEKDVAEFWIELGEKFVYIRYFALRDGDGTYRGTLEVVQDATRVRTLEGQRRLLDW
ncbi:MAG TPA: DUF438 domain-containing protein [Thermoleophilia bacterium]|nr:DUF438 domain-containing protein [Thermoleophilia bacterium]